MQNIATLDQLKQNQHGMLLEPPLPSVMPEKPSARKKQALAEMLGRICVLQKTYGKTQAELETLVEGFAWILAEHELSDIRDAFKEYITRKSDIPAPADIIKIIEENKSYAVPAREFRIETLLEFKRLGLPLTSEQQSQLSQQGVV